MSLFWRILFAFVVTVAITFLGQRWVGISESKLPTLPLLTMSGSPLVLATGQSALDNALRGDRAAALRKLQPIEESGIHAWLVTKQETLGASELDPGCKKAAEDLLRSNRDAKTPFGYRIAKLNGDGALVLLVPGFSSAPHLAWRAVLLIAIPVGIGLWLAKRLSAPIEKISKAATQMASGDLSARAGKLNGPREVEKLGLAFDTMANRVQQTLEAQNRLLVDVSHETRSPLTRIRLAAKMLAEGKGTIEANVGRIERDVMRLDELIGTLSTIVRPDEAIQRDQLIELSDLVREVMESLALEAEAKQIHLSSAILSSSFQGNYPLVRSAIENVVRNAIIHSPPGSAVEMHVLEDPIRVQVLDQGPGVPTEELKKIFDPFYRQSEARERDSGGLGLGLAIANRATILHGGRAFAELRDDGGLAVTLVFGGY